MANNAHFIQNAIKRPGAFSAKAQRAGLSTKQYAMKKRHAKGRLGKQANLALTLMRLRGNK